MQEAEEHFDVCDETGLRSLGTAPRSQVHREGLWHRSVEIWLLNDTGQLLLQLRSASKDVYPDRWDVSCAGHVEAGGSSLPAALRELHEELGLQVGESELRHLFSTRKTFAIPRLHLLDNELCDIFLLRGSWQDSDLSPCPDEVAGLRWISPADLLAWIHERPHELVPHLGHYRRIAALAQQESLS